MKTIKDCWLSPKGDVYWCREYESHMRAAERLICELNLTEEFSKFKEEFPNMSEGTFLYRKGFVRYIRWILPKERWAINNHRLTKAQKDKIYELTGDFYDWW